jgi:SAM-dependent methyltransferase
MSTRFYKVLYRMGLTPWEDPHSQGGSGEQVTAMFDREESGRQAPYGTALDLGCGTGRFTVELARRGWQVTGVDIVPKAVSSARERAREAGAEVRFVEANVANLTAADVGSGFRLVLDFGTIHGLSDEDRAAVGRLVNQVATADASLLMFVFGPGRRGPAPRGMSRADIETTYPGWRVTDEEAADVNLPGILKADPYWYRLRRD